MVRSRIGKSARIAERQTYAAREAEIVATVHEVPAEEPKVEATTEE